MDTQSLIKKVVATLGAGFLVSGCFGCIAGVKPLPVHNACFQKETKAPTRFKIMHTSKLLKDLMD